MAIAPLPPVKARLHVWWGNYEGPYERDVDLADIWSEIAKANARSYFVSMANSRYAHGYRLFERAALSARRRCCHRDGAVVRIRNRSRTEPLPLLQWLPKRVRKPHSAALSG
jgi:hypothetical protein